MGTKHGGKSRSHLNRTACLGTMAPSGSINWKWQIMKNNRTQIIGLFCSCVLMPGKTWAENTNASAVNVLIEVGEKATKGFPVILRVTARGPQRVPKMTVFDYWGDIAVQFVSKTDGAEYVISSSRGVDVMITSPEGVRHDEIARRMWNVSLKEDEERAMLMDVSSLRPESGIGTILDDVPPGEYTISVQFSYSKKKSNSVDIALLEPSETERDLVHEILKKGVLKRRQGVNWSKFLRANIALPPNSLQKIRAHTRSQMQFHDLLSRVLSREMYLRTELEVLPVPEYLNVEKACLLLELDTTTEDKDVGKRREALLIRHPDVRWRFENVESGTTQFLKWRWKEQ